MSEWQPAVVAPIEHMCDTHRAILSSANANALQNRQQLQGVRVEIRVKEKPTYCNGRLVPHGDCVPIIIKTPDGRMLAAFSCDVLMD
jgi:hypothetical protein